METACKMYRLDLEVAYGEELGFAPSNSEPPSKHDRYLPACFFLGRFHHVMEKPASLRLFPSQGWITG
jgi:hypothetical protein